MRRRPLLCSPSCCAADGARQYDGAVAPTRGHLGSTSDLLPSIEGRVPHPRWILAGAAIVLLTAAVALATLAMRQSQQGLIDSLNGTLAFAQNVDLARDAQVHFKREVQEWKDVLLRGHRAIDYAKYWSLFEQEEARTQALLEDIKRREPRESGEIDALLAGLGGIGQRYRTAVARLDASDPLSYRAVDSEVRGMDRPLTDQMSALVARLQQRMASLGHEMSATHESAISHLRLAVIVAALLGMLSMVMLMLLVRRAERERAEASGLAKSAFLATMSHEIRTPMNAVLGMANLLEHTSLTATQSDYLAKLQAASRHLLSIIDDILDLSKIEASRLELEHLVFSLDDVLDDVATLVGARAAEKGIELVLSRQSNVPVLLLGDPLRIGQIISNLASNAVKFTEKGEVQVRVSKKGADSERVNLYCEVIDSGIGLSSEQQARLFQPFAQADGSTTRRFGGTGLGLAICARLVKMMGGTIGVESKSGEGSRFYFTLPLRSRSDDRRQQPGLPPGLHGRKVLVGVANSTMREAVSQSLRSAGLSVTCVGDAPSVATALLSTEHGFEAAIVDWRLNPTGIGALLSVCRDHRSILPERFLVLTSQVDAEEAHATLRTLGLGVLLIKPASPSALFESVARAFGAEQRSRAKQGSRRGGLSVPGSWASLRGLRVLLVEDNAINQEVAAATLRLVGLSVSVCSNGQDAVAAIAASWETGRPFALVLMDRHMPGMDGIDTTRQIRLDSRSAALPIIAMTADVVGGARDECQAAGMNDFVSKPFEAEALLEVIARWALKDVRADGIHSDAERRELPAGLPGIDIETGLRYLGGETTVYRRLLLRFRSDFQAADRRVADLLLQGKVAEAEREVHSLKGLAGQMGAHALRRCADELQSAIKSGDASLDGKLRALADSLSVVMTGLDELCSAVVCESASEPGRPRDVAGLSERLSAMLAVNDPDAHQVAKDLRDALSGPARRQAEQLMRRLEQYDFQGARQLLPEISGAEGPAEDHP